MTEGSINRRGFGKALSTAVAGLALPTMLVGQAQAADVFREGLQIGAMGALRTTLPGADKKYDLTFDAKDFRDSTSVLLAIEQGELEIGNTTTQHLIRAISENRAPPQPRAADVALVYELLFDLLETSGETQFTFT